MITSAKLKENEIIRECEKIRYDLDFMFYNGAYSSLPEIKNDTWSEHSFASVNKKGELIGYIHYSIDRNSYNVTSLGAVNFKFKEDATTKYIFGRDLEQIVKDIFTKFGFNKISFGVYIGNPAEDSYDRIMKKYNGRIVGIMKNDNRLIDGKYYDYKMYEILKDEFIKALK